MRDGIEELVAKLVALPTETEWVEFKHNNQNPEEIGEYCSALANGAALHGQSHGYLVWGIEDGTHKIVGTDVRLKQIKKGNEELENWLLRCLHPRIDMQLQSCEIQGNHVELLKLQAAQSAPVRFHSTEYIRVGSYKKKLADHPEKERRLWRIFQRHRFEDDMAAEGLEAGEVLELLNYRAYFELLKHPLPTERKPILEKLVADRLVRSEVHGIYDVTNLGALLFASNLGDFQRLERKALRVVVYNGVHRIRAERERTISQGYAVGFQDAVQWINDQLPVNEEIRKAIREEVRTYPEVAIRELAANSLIHQDLMVVGAGPMIEIFDDRMEFTNPGVPLIDPQRFIDEPPRSRNEQLAGLMRRLGICEERGSGIDKVVFHIEVYQLPAPDFRVTQGSTVAVLYAPRTFADMNREERIRACYQHACLLYVSNQRMSNATLRKRLGIDDENYPMASRVIRDSIDAGKVKKSGEGGSRRDVSYVPFWA